MTDPRDGSPGRDDATTGIDDLTTEILPALIARLRASRLGELEVRTSGWRVRLRRDLRATRRTSQPGVGSASPPEDPEDPADGAARSPAVGYFNPLPRLAIGQLVQAGDQLGNVDMLGIAQDVVAPVGGIVRAILAEPGQAVEYGQALVEIDALALDPVDADDHPAAEEPEALQPVGPGGAAVAGP
jgi:biotin carboxyl carrier protein